MTRRQKGVPDGLRKCPAGIAATNQTDCEKSTERTEQLRQRVEDELRKAAQSLARFSSNTPDLVFAKDCQSRLVYASESCLRLLGKTAEEVLARTPVDYHLDRRLAEAILENDRRVCATRRPLVVEETMRLADGSLGIFQSTKVPLIAEDGTLLGIVGIAVDITARKKAEETLRQSEEKFARAFASNPAALAMTRLEDGVIMDVNGTWETTFGYTRDKAIGHTTLELGFWRAPEDRQRLIEELRTHGKVRNLEERVAKRSGEPFVALASAEILNVGGEEMILSTWLDISDRKRAEDALRESEEKYRKINETLEQRMAEIRQQADQLRALATELGRAEQSERQRLAKVLHENIQQLLVAAQMRLDQIQDGDLKSARSEARRVHAILGEALDASRSLTVEVCPPVLHQSGLAAALTWLARRMTEKHCFKVHVRTARNAEPATPEVREFLFDAVREMLLNAVKYSGMREARLTMARTRGHACRITVADRGRGFDPAAIHPGDGGGFGLFSIQQRLICLGGKLEIQSAPGQGARAVLTFPLAGGAAPQTAAATSR